MATRSCLPSWLPDLGSQILATRFRLPHHGYQILATRSWLPDPGYQLLAITSWLMGFYPSPHVMLHLGDQVYAKEHDWTTAATRIMDICEKPGVTNAVRLRAEQQAAQSLQRSYRSTWYPSGVATVLSRSSHLMIWSDNDVRDDN